MHKSIFVSSTFKDFQRERDLLQTKVELRVNELLQHMQVSFLDLRWGIDTTGETSLHKVVSICIAEVLNSHPFYVIMLGDTYGSCVEETVARSLYALNGLAYDGKEKSVTQIEIEATGLLEGNNEFVLVLDRHTDATPDPRAAALKQQVLDAALAENIYTYTAHAHDGTYIPESEEQLTEFIARRLRDFLKDLTELTEPHTVTLAKEQAERFCGRQALLEQAHAAVLSHRDGNLMRIYAPPGAGLSALLSKLYARLREDGSEAAFLAEHSQLPMPFTGVLAELAIQFGIEMDSHGGFFSRLDPDKRYYCFLDSLEELTGDPVFLTMLIRQQIPENVLFILGTNTEDHAHFSLEYPTKADALALFDGTVTAYRKELPAAFREYFRENIPEEMVRQPAFLKQFIAALCYLTQEDYCALAGGGSFADRLSELFISKLQSFPANEKAHIHSVLHSGDEEQLWIMGMLAVATGSLEGRLLLGALRGGGIECDLLQLRTVKERFRDSIYCPQENSYAISRASFRTAVLDCFTPEQQKWLRYLLVDYLAQNIALHVHPDIFPEIAYQYLLLEDYELLARLLEQSCIMPDDGRQNGLRFALLCGDYGAEAPSRHYRALAAQGNPFCDRWLVQYAMPYITELYRQNGADMFGKMYETVIRDGRDSQNAADLLALQVHGMALGGFGAQAIELTMQELKNGHLKLMPSGIMIGQYLTSCLRYDSRSAAQAIDFLLESLDLSAAGIEELLSQYLKITVIMDGDAVAYRPQLEKLCAACEAFLEAREYTNVFSVALPLYYLSQRLQVPLRNKQRTMAAIASEDSRMDYPLSLQFLAAYMDFLQQADDGSALGRLLAVVEDRRIALSTVDLFFASRFFRQVCYQSKGVNAPRECCGYIRGLYQRFWEIRGMVWCGMQNTEMIYLGCLMCLYGGVEECLALMKEQLDDPRLTTQILMTDFEFFCEDAQELIDLLDQQEAMDQLEAIWTQRK